MATLLEKANQILDEKNAKILSENIKSGIQVFDIAGNYTADANATADNIEQGKTAYVNGEKVEGSLQVFGVPTDTASNVQYQESTIGNYVVSTAPRAQTGIIKQGTNVYMKSEASKVASAIGLTAEKLVKGNNILGIDGTAETGGSSIILSDCSYLFAKGARLTQIDDLLSICDMTNADHMFDGCSSLTSLPQLDTSKVTSMMYMFNGCSMLKGIPLFDTSKVRNMSSMFNGCSNLASIPEFDTSTLYTVSNMFYGCSKLTEVPLINTNKVTAFTFMFYGCSSLVTIPVFDTSNLTTMGSAFGSCTSLSDESLDNILMMCINAVKISSNKTLKYIGLTSNQATTCATLSNYQAFLDAGWTTGY